jgi:MoCo/4Fe-4S cofactor protein with predicted Tat translocation signal
MSVDPNPKQVEREAPMPSEVNTLEAARAFLAAGGKKRLWQSLEQLANTPEYREFLEHEFPHQTAEKPEVAVNAIGRRDWMKLAGASAAMAGLSACTKLPVEKIVPYVKPPEEIIPGKPLFYATSMIHGGEATGLLVESHMGRPTKIEGNAEHPGSLGGTDVFHQASVLTLWDPDRAQTVVSMGRISTWGTFLSALGNARSGLAPRGAGLRILTGTVNSPSVAAQLKSILTQFPDAKWHQYEPAGRDNAREGSRLAFGKYVNTVYRIDQADVIVSLDADFLTQGPGHVRYAREFASRRTAETPQANLNRLYAVESMPSSTGAVADHRRPLRAGDIPALAVRLATALGVLNETSGGQSPHDWAKIVSKDLQNHRGTSLIIPGEGQPPIVHALAHAMNAALGNAGKTLYYTDPIEANPTNELESLRELVNDLNAGKVDVLLISGPNPLYDAPADLDFKSAFMKARLRIYHGLYNDETAELCEWFVPDAHYLEAWGDGRAYDGTIGIVQPLIAPLYDSHSQHELFSVLAGESGKSGHDIVQAYWKTAHPVADFEPFWERTLHDGLMASTALPAVTVTPQLADIVKQAASVPAGGPESDIEIVFRPDPAIGDGRWANNGWLQELPKPITRLTWDNAAIMSPKTAAKLNVKAGDYVSLKRGSCEAKTGVWIVPGHADDSVTFHLGFGRWRSGKIGDGPGSSAYLIRTTDGLWQAGGLQIEKTGKQFYFATTQHQYTIDQAPSEEVEKESVNAFRRDLVQIATIDEFRKDPKFAKNPEAEETEGLTIYPRRPEYSEGYGWGMSIDLNKCVGCNACVIACQSENNIATVGKDQVMRGRSMHWIRIDTYFKGDMDDPEIYYEPMPCQQCENAPCEYVCPVGATTHSPEGLNEMTYNRCVGTRYCSNNCPYKVRRFNFLLFSDWVTQSLYGLRNPNVTVRSRGVMEKCTYCVQRINAAKIRAEEEDRPVRDGEIVTACQAACPAEAIVFGNINDPNSRVSKLKAGTRDYTILDDLNTRPRTSYLARVRNPNPEMHG